MNFLPFKFCRKRLLQNISSACVLCVFVHVVFWLVGLWTWVLAAVMLAEFGQKFLTPSDFCLLCVSQHDLRSLLWFPVRWFYDITTVNFGLRQAETAQSKGAWSHWSLLITGPNWSLCVRKPNILSLMALQDADKSSDRQKAILTVPCVFFLSCCQSATCLTESSCQRIVTAACLL